MSKNDDTCRTLLCHNRRPSVADYLASQHTKELLNRMPQFEQRTYTDLDRLNKEVSALSFRLMVTNWVIVLLVMIAMFLMLRQGAPL